MLLFFATSKCTRMELSEKKHDDLKREQKDKNEYFSPFNSVDDTMNVCAYFKTQNAIKNHVYLYLLLLSIQHKTIRNWLKIP